MIGDLPARWRREADINHQTAMERLKEDRPESALRLLSFATATRQCADELEAELDEEDLHSD